MAALMKMAWQRRGENAQKQKRWRKSENEKRRNGVKWRRKSMAASIGWRENENENQLAAAKIYGIAKISAKHRHRRGVMAAKAAADVSKWRK